MCQFPQLCPGLTQANLGQQANSKQQFSTHIDMTGELFVYQPGVKHNMAGKVYHKRPLQSNESREH